MEPGTEKRAPWKGWTDFTSWAQDFSLRKKVLGGFLAVVILVGILTGLIGTRLVKGTIMDRARSRLMSDLGTAGFALESTIDNLRLKIRLTADSESVIELLKQRDPDGIRNRLNLLAVENDLDFLTLTDSQGNVLARAFVSGESLAGASKEQSGEDAEEGLSSGSLVQEALKGNSSAGLRLIPKEKLVQENSNLAVQFGREEREHGLVMASARPILIDKSIEGVVYGGVLITGSPFVAKKMSKLIFKGQTYNDHALGYVTIFQLDRVSSTTFVQNDDATPVAEKAAGFILRDVLRDGETAFDRITYNNRNYLSAARPLKDSSDKIIGAIEVATLEKPISAAIDRLVVTFMLVALVGVLLMAAISYFLVQWINRPLELMLNSAKRAAEGDLSHQIPVTSRDEVGELAATFNLMIRNLAESQSKLEEWGKELASKVAAQTGELLQAREQVARVKKLASLEKMADGMAHIMGHISDPMVRPVEGAEEEATTRRILVLDDEERVLEICQQILEDEGFHVKVTRKAEEAFSVLEEEFYDVVVADIDTPDLSGKDLLKEIKYRQPEIIVILTAPFKSTEEAVEAVKLGAFDYLPKPFGPHQILLMVYTALQTRQMLDKTRLQHAEQRAETIFQRLPVAIALADKAHRVVYNNKAFVDLASEDGKETVRGKTFQELFGVDPLDREAEIQDQEKPGSRWLELGKVGRTAKLYNFKLPDEDLRVLMLLDITETVKKDQEADVFRSETMARAQQVIHQQMRVAQEIAGLLGETTAETKAALFELIKLAGDQGAQR